jgi:hypothetical protein
MSAIWFLAKLALFAFVLSVLLRQSYNLIFFAGRKPVLWIASVGTLGFVIVAIAALLHWSSTLVAWAYMLALALNVPGFRNARFGKEATAEAAAVADRVYAEMGINGGRRKYRIGLVAFALTAFIAYLLFYGEVCSAKGDCVPLVKPLANG